MSRAWTGLIVVVASVAATASAGDAVVISGATVIDGTGRAPVKDAVIVIQGGRIAQVGPRPEVKIPEDAQAIEAGGKFVIPGLADMHNHLGDGTFNFLGQSEKKNLARLLGAGVTLTFDTACEMKVFVELKAAAKDDAAPFPRFFAAGHIFSAKGGWPVGPECYTPATADEARANVRELKAAGVDAIKLIRDDMSWLRKKPFPLLEPDVMAAIIDEAHRQGLKAYAHAPILKYAKEALRAGADGLVHGIISDPVDDEFLALMKKNRAIYIATMSLFEACADLSAWVKRESAFDDRGVMPRETYESVGSPFSLIGWNLMWDNTGYAKQRMPVLRANLKAVHDAGIPVVAGTDTGVPGVLLGVSSQMELLLHVEAGLRPEDALRAATVGAARMLGLGRELGTVEPGKLADLLILDADPLADIRNVRRIHRVVKGGVARDPVELLRAGRRPAAPARR